MTELPMTELPMQVADPGGTTLKQRWNTQISPFGSKATLMSSPHLPPFMLGGSVGQSSTRR